MLHWHWMPSPLCTGSYRRLFLWFSVLDPEKRLSSSVKTNLGPIGQLMIAGALYTGTGTAGNEWLVCIIVNSGFHVVCIGKSL